jgi:tetratricopeptide (TPR) repeat protein
LSDFRYRAYLSYSHEDTEWATWLHRALERYRVPARLQSVTGAELPDRLAPVFRDRDDLSSASDLSKKLGHALDESEHLIVICSPAAAESRWVNQEILEFRALGRPDNIHCMVVAGNPGAPVGEGGCFPPALFDGVADGGAEPLAADPREFADGKRLALQKIIAGLLGVPLDALRRRDLVRRRRVQAIAALGVVAALVLLGQTYLSRLAEQQERARAEQMASFIVDLGEDLQDELDLESLGRISTTAMGYLEQLEPARLAPETRLKVGLALRQVGEVNLYQGNYEDSRRAYERSHGVFRDLYALDPENDDVVFELSQSEFYVGEFYRNRGEVDRTLEHWQNYFSIAREQHEKKPDDPTWLLEYSYASSNLTNFRIDQNEPVDAAMLADIDRNIALAGRALEVWDGDADVLGHYGNELAWGADAHADSCDLEPARQARVAALAVAEQLAAQQPGSRSLQLDVAYRHGGLAGLLLVLGEVDRAVAHYDETLNILRALLARDPSSERYQRDLNFYMGHAAQAYRHLGDLVRARSYLEESRQLAEQIVAGEAATAVDRDDFLYLLEERARVALAEGDLDLATELLGTHGEALVALRGGERDFQPDYRRLVNHRYLQWMMDGTDPAMLNPELLARLPRLEGSFRPCGEAFAGARHALMIDARSELETQIAYLEQAGYRHPDYLEFCRRVGGCGSPDPNARGWLRPETGEIAP